MRAGRWLSGLGWAGVALVFALGLWFRITSLKTAPEPTGDEAIYGVQAIHLLRGLPVTIKTVSGHAMSPFLMLMQAPLLLVSEPSYTALRIPIALGGVLTVVLVHVLGANVLDRTTGLIAAGLLASLPIAIIFSRLAWEPGQVPLVGVVALFLAFRGRRLAVLLVWLVGLLLVHPTNLMLAPLLLCVLVVALHRQHAGDPVRRWRTPLVTALIGAAIVLPLALRSRSSPAAQWTYAHYKFGHCDWGRFATLLRKMLMGFCMGAPTETSIAHAWAFWGVVLPVVAPGSWVIVRRRQWDRAALVFGTLATVAGFHLALGPDALHPALSRYGIFLVVPLCLSFACLLRALLVEGQAPLARAARRAQVAALLAGALVLLHGVKVNWFDVYIGQSRGRERIWTLRTEAIEPKLKMMRILLRDMAGAGPARPGRWVIVAEDWWSYRPLQFFAAWRDDIRVACLERVAAPQERQRILRAQLDGGGYVVATAGGEVDRLVAATFPAAALRSWAVQEGAHPTMMMYRLRRPDESAPAAHLAADRSARRAGEESDRQIRLRGPST